MNLYSIIVSGTAGFFVYFLYKKSRHILSADLFWKLAFLISLFSLVGSKVFFLLESYLTEQSLIQDFLSPYGFSILGAITFGFISLWFLSVLYKFNLSPISDLIFLYLPLAQALGRFGNIANQELLPFSYYEIILNLISFIILYRISMIKKYRGLVTALFFLNYGLIRIFIEVMKGNLIGFLTIVSYAFLVFGFLRVMKLVFKI